MDYRVEYQPTKDGHSGEYIILQGDFGITSERCRTHSYLAAVEILAALRTVGNRIANKRYTDAYNSAVNTVCNAKRNPSYPQP